MIRNRYIHKTRRTRTNVEKFNNRLGVDMNTEPILMMPDRVIHNVKIKLRKFGETIRFVEYSPDAAA